MAETDYAVLLYLRRTTYPGVGDVGAREGWKVVAGALPGGTVYELTKEYPTHHEAMQALSSTLRKLTVETSGEAP